MFDSWDTLAKHGNLLISHAMPANTIKTVREGLSVLLTIPTLAAFTHKGIAYRFTNEQIVINGEYVDGLSILRCMKEGI